MIVHLLRAIGAWLQSHNFNSNYRCLVSSFGNRVWLEVNYLPDECKKTGPRVTVPKPELTKDKKYRCPLDQEVYDNKEDYEAHCKEEHDVL